MNDTPAIVNMTYRQLLDRVTGEERLRFASDSFEAAKVIVRSSFSGIEDDVLLKKEMFLRFYGNDVGEMFTKKFFEHLSVNSRQEIRDKTSDTGPKTKHYAPSTTD